jgi:ribonuclease HI
MLGDMVRLPRTLEQKLELLFPDTEDRARFIADAVEQALTSEPDATDAPLPNAVGGTLHLFSDGGSRGNPGLAAVGCVLEDPSQGITLAEHGEVIGTETNNVAEYKALIAGLKMAQNYQPSRLVCHLDSELIVKQMNGEYRVKMATLQPLFEEVRRLALDLPDVIFKHIPRGDNYRADALVNKALDAAGRRGVRPSGTPTIRPTPIRPNW